MVELTDQEKLERRRQKRQQRILQAGESRLSKITGTAFPNRATPSPTPSPSTSSLKTPEPTSTTSFRTQRRDSDDPSEELGAPQPLAADELMNQTFQNMFGGGISGIPGSEGMGFNPAALLGAMGGGGQNNEELQKMLSGNSENNTPFNPAAMFGNVEQQVDESTKYWNVLHLIIMVMLGMYSVYIEWTRGGSERFSALLSSNIGVSNYPSIHVPLFWYFVTIELGLQSARMFYQQGTMPPTSTIATLATQLPSPFGNIVTIFLRYRLIWTCLVQDICILVFIIGLSQVVSHTLLN